MTANRLRGFWNPQNARPSAAVSRPDLVAERNATGGDSVDVSVLRDIVLTALDSAIRADVESIDALFDDASELSDVELAELSRAAGWE